jgi:predicted dehydrogenase
VSVDARHPIPGGGVITATTSGRPPRLGFLGVGWIGRHRMQALCAAGQAEAVAVADPDPAARIAAAQAVPGVTVVERLEDLLALELDGIVIATPSAMHAEQALAGLAAGVAVFCQKPLARDAEETRAVVAAARDADRRLGVDFSYRHLAATRAARAAIVSGELGDIFAVDLTFHNAYGPDKPWFGDRRLAGGGCLIDLGTHLVDLALWLTDGGSAQVQAARVLRGGRLLDLASEPTAVEDFAVAHLLTDNGVTARVACSWWEPVGADCEIAFTVRGSAGAFAVANVDGSFLDFAGYRLQGRERRLVCGPPDDWGPRALSEWASGLAQGAGFDEAVEAVIGVAKTIDAVYATAAGARR